jgi:oligopeptide/dipeptide ABC transporter ATP-binding protein
MLEVRDLEVAFPVAGGLEARAVRSASFRLDAGEIVGVVGESGSGKTLTALAVLGLVPPPGRIVGGSILFEGRELRDLPEKEYRRVRGARIGLVFQEPMAALNPVLSIGSQIIEAIRAHLPVSRREARQRAVELLAELAVPDPEERLKLYPHELSGGQRQRALLAIALAASPDLLLADEPTTALDVTVQAQVLELLAALRRDRGLGILLVTHDLGVVAEVCDRLLVLYAGQVVEEGPTAEVLARPAHPYTRALLAAVPRAGEGRAAGPLASIPGVVPPLTALPPGCAFHPRCGEALPRCREVEPAMVAIGARHSARCLLLDGGGPA